MASLFAAARLLASSSSVQFARSSTPSIVSSARWYASAAALSRPEVTERVIKIVGQFDKVDAAKVNEKSHFISDLGLDSLDAVELIMALEDEFAFEVPETDLENIVSVEQAIAYVLANPHAK